MRSRNEYHSREELNGAGHSASATATAGSMLSSHIFLSIICSKFDPVNCNVYVRVVPWEAVSFRPFSTITLAHPSLLPHIISPQSMPDRKDGTATAGTIKNNENTNKRGSVFMESGTPDVDSGSKTSLPSTSPVASGRTGKETSPKKRRKVNHGQDEQFAGSKFGDTRY